MANNLPNFGDRSIDNFKSALVGGGARANLFEVELAFPAASGQTNTGGTASPQQSFTGFSGTGSFSRNAGSTITGTGRTCVSRCG